MVNNNPVNQADQSKARTKRLNRIVITGCGVIALCGIVFGILLAINWLNTFKAKTNALFFKNASISHMFEVCEPELYHEWQAWMQAQEGSSTVLAIYYSKMSPVPDGLYAYELFLQIEPTLVVAGQELSFPGEGIQAFLIETRAPFVACSPDMKGALKILSISGGSLIAKIDVNGVINKNSWAYSGEPEFKEEPIPK